MGTSSGAYELNDECASINYTHQNSYPCFITALIHGYRYFISILTRLQVPLKCPELAFWKADLDRMTFSHVLFSFSLKTHGFLVTIHGYRCFISIRTRPYLSNVLH